MDLSYSTIIKRKLSFPDYILVAANLLPVAGVLFWNWSPVAIFLAYAAETIIIGVFTLLKLGVVTVTRKNDTWNSGGRQTKQPGITFMLFFVAHYGMFVTIQMLLFAGVSGIGKGTGINFFNFLVKWPSLITGNVLIMLGGFILYHLLRFFMDFIYPKEYKTVSMMKLMFQPYGRIIIQQFTVILGSMFLTFGAGKLFIIVFALIKIFFEVFINYEGLLEKGMQQVKTDSGEQ